MRNRWMVPVAAVCAALLLSGCGDLRYETDTGEGRQAGHLYEVKTDMDDLTMGQFYIYHKGTYTTPYIGEANFNPEKTGGGSRRVAWFLEDELEKIPTLYSGDTLVYITDESFSETFRIERFKNLGYTIGVCNLDKRGSGRYVFDATAESRNINPSSDASRLASLNEAAVTFDSIGMAELRSGNVTEAGTIDGLRKDSYYKSEIYVGTELTVYNLKADSVAMCSYESVSSIDYSFLKSKVIRINIPSYFNSGYYRINGSGIFRYVKGSSYNDKTDFNIANVVPDGYSVSVDDTRKRIDEYGNGENVIPFVVRNEAEITARVTYIEEDEVRYGMPDPVISLVGANVSYSVPKAGASEYSLKVTLPTGKYTLKIKEMGGRSYDYEITSISEKEESE